ncbi:PAS domain-containing protein, partial [Thioclava sp. BHET1]
MIGDWDEPERPRLHLAGDSLPARPQELAQLYRYWDRLRGHRSAPKRAEIDPARLQGSLPGAFILERIAPGHAKLRVAGQALTQCLDMDPRGMPFGALFNLAAREMLPRELEPVFSEQHSLDLWLRGERGFGRPELCARVLILPLAGEDGRTNRALGGLCYAGKIGRAPRRFALDQLRRDIPQRAPPLQIGAAEPAAPFTPAPPGRPHPKAPY